MLRPDERELYLDLLRPPDGYRLDRAIGTTYSVDLLTLLAVPLSFARLDWGESRDDLLTDPIRLLRSLREHASRITLFCQAGRIAASARRHPLFAHLESVLVEAVAPSETGEFHAKTWVLRFVSEEAESPVRFRFLNMSRNLTTDRSWDGVVSLEGELTDRARAFAVNHPLGDFLEALPARALRQVPARLGAELQSLAGEVRRVRFEPPEPFDSYAFLPMGIAGYGAPAPSTEGASRLLIVSPFVSEGRLADLAQTGENILVSRPESLDTLPASALAAFQQVLVLQEATEEEVEPNEGGAESVPASTEEGQQKPSGLHAKLYLSERGWDATLRLGSTNATNAGFNNNVEFLVELTGKKSRVGIDLLLGAPEGRELRFGGLLTPYRPRVPPPLVDLVAKENEEAVESARRHLSRSDLRLVAAPAPEGETFEIELYLAGHLELGSAVRGRCWPQGHRAPSDWNLADLQRERVLRFKGMTLAHLSAFMAVELECGQGDQRSAVAFTLLLPLEGAPEDRLEQLLANLLQEPGRFLHLLQLLLADPEAAPTALAEVLSAAERQLGNGRGGHANLTPLLEDLLRALAGAPERLADVQRLVEDLRRSPSGMKVLPEGFEAIWQPIWAAREVRS